MDGRGGSLARRRPRGPATGPHTLDIRRDAVRVDFGRMRSGVLQIDELVVEVRPLPSPVDLGALRSGLADRAARLSRLRARVHDRQLTELLPGGLRATTLKGRLLIHGRLPSGGRLVVELLGAEPPEPGWVALRAGARLGIGGPADTLLQELIDGLSPDHRAVVALGPDGAGLRFEVLRPACAHALLPSGWKLPLVPEDLAARAYLGEGALLLETAAPGDEPFRDVASEPPAAVEDRCGAAEEARALLEEARRLHEAGDQEAAVALAGRLLAGSEGRLGAVCAEAATFLPAPALTPWLRDLRSSEREPAARSDFRLDAIEGSAAFAQGAPSEAAASWLRAADRAGAAGEPVFAVELVAGALDALGGGLDRHPAEQVAAVLDRLAPRLPDDPRIGDWVLALGAAAPFDLRHRALHSALFTRTPAEDLLRRAHDLIAEALRTDRRHAAADLAAIVERWPAAGPDTLLLCARALEADGRSARAVALWERVRDRATARGDLDLRLAASVHLSTHAPGPRSRARLVELAPEVQGLPKATAAWLARANDDPELLDPVLLRKAMSSLHPKADPDLLLALRGCVAARGDADLAAELATTTLRLGVALAEDLAPLRIRALAEGSARALFRALRSAAAREAGPPREELAALMGRILLRRYDRAVDALPHLESAWTSGARDASLADDLIEARLRVEDWPGAQEILAARLAAEGDPELRVRIGVELLSILPPGTPLRPEVREMLDSACRAVPWEEDLRAYLEARDRAPAGNGTETETETETGTGAETGTETEIETEIETGAEEGDDETAGIDPGPALAAAREALAQGRLGEARTRVESVLDRHPDLPGALSLLAQVAEASGQLDEAADLLRRRIGLAFDVEEARPLVIHALDLLLAAGRTEEARHELAQIRRADPDLAGALPGRLQRLLDP